MKTLLSAFVALAGSFPLLSSAIESTAKPDLQLVKRYEANDKELKAKLAECNAKNDLAAVLTDVSCMSAQEVEKWRMKKMLSSKCNVADTFIFLPPNVKGAALEAYVRKNIPQEGALSACNMTKEQWVVETLNQSKK